MEGTSRYIYYRRKQKQNNLLYNVEFQLIYYICLLCYSWRPPELPKCISGFHPKMEWLSKRSADYEHEPVRIPKRVKRELRRRQKKLDKLGRIP